jgi:probable F420-dependent oxidoreductase
MEVRVGLGPAGVPAIRELDDRSRFVDFVRKAEALGYASVCVGDHLDERGAPLALLAAAAMESTMLTLAVHVLNAELRNAAVLAQEARTVQVLSAGRLELGLGAGWLQRDFDVAGIAMAPFEARLAKLAAVIAQVRSSAGGSNIAAPTLVVGGGGPRMLAFAARHADIVTVNIPLRGASGLATNTVASGTRPAFEQRITRVRDAAAAAGRAVELHAYVHNVHLGPGWEGEATLAAERIGLSLGDYVGSPHVLAGEPDDVAATVRRRHAELGLAYFSIPGAAAEPFAEVLRRLEEDP